MIQKFRRLLLCIFLSLLILSVNAQVYEADNGITASGAGLSRKVSLGGALSGNTEIPFNGFEIHFTGLGRIGIGTNSPAAHLSIAGASAGTSGLHFTQLNSSSTAVTGNGKVLSVDANGHVILVNDEGSDGTVWKLGGNTGTTPGTHFLGTGDNNDLVFKINNTERMRLTTTGRLSLMGDFWLANQGDLQMGSIRFNPNNGGELSLNAGTTNPIRINGNLRMGQSAFIQNSDGFNVLQFYSGTIDGYEQPLRVYGPMALDNNLEYPHILGRNNLELTFGTADDLNNKKFTISHGTGTGTREPLLTIQENGLTGLGTATPAAFLHLHTGASSTVPVFRITESNYTSPNELRLAFFQDNGSAKLQIKHRTASAALELISSSNVAGYLHALMQDFHIGASASAPYINFDHNIRPTSSGTFDNGSANRMWNNVYVKSMIANGSINTIKFLGDRDDGNYAYGAVRIESPYNFVNQPYFAVGNHQTTFFAVHKSGALKVGLGEGEGYNLRSVAHPTAMVDIKSTETDLDLLKVRNYANVAQLLVNKDGNVAIGNVTPTAQLHTTGSVRFAGLTNDNTQTRVLVSDANGNLSYRDAATLGGGSTADVWVMDGNTVSNNKSIGTTNQHALNIITNNESRIFVAADGNVGIGTTNVTDPDYRLSVQGNVRVRKIRVDQNQWADYVFESDYPLRPLEEVEAFINKNKHLPEVPTAKDVAREGIDLGDNQVLLLKKIEELTLYLLQQNKEIASLKQTVEQQQQQIEALKKQAKENR